MKQNERAVSPVIGVMLMIVVTIIIAAVVATFAGNTDLAKRAGPSTTLSAQIMYSTVPQEVSVSWDTVTTVAGHPAVDCNSIPSSGDAYSDLCKSLHGVADDGQNYCSQEETVLYGAADECNYAASEDTTVTTSHTSDTYLANKDGLLFTDNGGDPLDLKELEMTVRHYNLASTVYYSDVKNFAPTAIPSGAVNVAGSVDQYNSLSDKYFVKVNATSSDDTIIRQGDQFMFLVDHQDKNNQFDPTAWALSSTRSDPGINNEPSYGASLGINTYSGETEWWLTHSPSGTTLAHGTFEFPNT